MLLYILLSVAVISTVVGGSGGDGARIVVGLVTPALRHAEKKIKKIDGEIKGMIFMIFLILH